MKRARLKYVSLILCVLMILLGSGCGASLFTSEHKHYHGTQKFDEKLEHLEQRIEHLETMHPH
ncbi:MAG: hypothetical protein HQ515_00835 [Phycisphaeraceae bacterium]|nr:hypothetical protein [Phycisphaeraceae bacterium]